MSEAKTEFDNALNDRMINHTLAGSSIDYTIANDFATWGREFGRQQAKGLVEAVNNEIAILTGAGLRGSAFALKQALAKFKGASVDKGEGEK